MSEFGYSSPLAPGGVSYTQEEEKNLRRAFLILYRKHRLLLRSCTLDWPIDSGSHFERVSSPGGALYMWLTGKPWRCYATVSAFLDYCGARESMDIPEDEIYSLLERYMK